MSDTATPSLAPALKQTLWYGAAASAFMALHAPEAASQIVYVDLEPDVVLKSDDAAATDAIFILDMTGDGNPEMVFREDFAGQSGTPRDYTQMFSSSAFTQTTGPDSLLGVIGSVIPYGGVDYNYPFPLSAGVEFATSEEFVGGRAFYSFTFTGFDPLNWKGVEGYVAVKFRNGAADGSFTDHLAWVRVEIPAEGGSMTIKDYAFNATPGGALTTGDRGSVSNETDGTLAETYRLSGAYPNPFNPQSRFSLEVREAQNVTIALYDVLGRQVATLHNGLLNAGTKHDFTLDGAGLPSGAYLVRIQGERFSETMNVTLAK